MDKHNPLSPRLSASGPLNQNEWLPIFVLRLIGYALLLLTLVDTLAILVPPKLFDPAWELETIGHLVERIPVPLIGFALVIYGGPRFRQSLDQYCFRAVPMVAFFLGVCFCLMIPLGIADSRRLGQDYQQMKATLTQQRAELRKVEQEFRNASASDVMAQAQKSQLQITLDQEPEAIKTRVLAQLQSQQQTLQNRTDRVAQQSLGLLKNAIKWLVGAVIASLSFLYMGHTVRKFSNIKMR